MEKKICPCAGCGVTIARGKLMCLEHWRMVPKRLRGDVTRTWNAFRQAFPENRLDALKRYREASSAAIAAAEEMMP